MRATALLLCALARSALLSARAAPTVVLAPSSATSLAPFVVEGARALRVEVRCPPRFPARVFQQQSPARSLCGRGFSGSAAQLNAWARGVTLAATAAVGEGVLEFRVREEGAQGVEVAALRVLSVAALAVQSPTAVRLRAQGESVVVARVDLRRLPASPSLAVLAEGDWPQGLSASVEGSAVRLRLDRAPAAALALRLRFRVRDERSGLLSPPLSVRLSVAGTALSALSYLGALLAVALFFLLSLLYVLAAARRLGRAEDKPPAADPIAAWNRRVLSAVKPGQSVLCTTAASDGERQFRDVTLDRISPLELSQATVASDDLAYLSAIICGNEEQPGRRDEPL